MFFVPIGMAPLLPHRPHAATDYLDERPAVHPVHMRAYNRRAENSPAVFMPIAVPKIIYLGRSRLHRNRANLVQTLHTVAALHRLGLDIELWLPPWNRQVTAGGRLADMGIEDAVRIRPKQFLHSRWPSALTPLCYRGALRRARAVYLRSPQLSLVLAHRGIAHSLEIHAVRELAADGILERIVSLQRAGMIEWLLPISETAREMLAEAGADPARMHVAPSGVDRTAYADIPAYSPRYPVPRVLYAGRISSSRGLDILLYLADRGLIALTLVGEQEDRVARHPRVTVRDHVPHGRVPALYRDTDLVLLPYQPALQHADAISPIKLFEAMAAGRPIIASDLAPLRDVLRHGENALLVPPSDPDAWAEALNALLEAPELARRIGAQARADAAAYSWDRRALGIARTLGWLT